MPTITTRAVLACQCPLRPLSRAHVVITAGNQSFSGTMLPRPGTLTRIQNVSTQLNLNTQVWRTDRDDKVPTVVPVGTEAGDDTVLAEPAWSSLDVLAGARDNPRGRPVRRPFAKSREGTFHSLANEGHPPNPRAKRRFIGAVAESSPRAKRHAGSRSGDEALEFVEPVSDQYHFGRRVGIDHHQEPVALRRYIGLPDPVIGCVGTTE